ncbi:hypothetical protein AMS68_000285 [Peltaster fructicola]|uniref:Phosducin domain-containing protein n=1 Tax=Peltaster fructicola TaxID=286661 RepID=A0A6H0XJF0_9PEZI|nr:hypothetical protein AMS68_000285 [Peltaster fructicola]
MASSEAQQEFDELMRNKERRGTHPEDGPGSVSEQNDDEHVYETMKEQAIPRQSMSSNRDIVPKARSGFNTGPKGVIADAQNYRTAQREYRSARNSTTVPPTEEELKLGQQLAIEKLAEVEEQDDLEDDNDDLDDEFMAQWRQQRLQAMHKGAYTNTIQDHSSSKKLYGKMSAVDAEAYLEIVEGSPESTVIVVFISDDASEVSQIFEFCLQSLASKHQSTRFIKLDYEEAEIEAAGVPGIIAYRGGEKFAALIPVLDEMPDDGDLDVTTLEQVMQKHQILR